MQGPVDEEQHATAVARPREVAEQQPGDQGEPDEGLHPLHPYHDSLQSEAGTYPLGEQALVLAANGSLRRMGPHRDQPEERVEIEAAQGAHMAADAEVTLLEEGLSQQWQAQQESGGQCGERCACPIEPGDPHRRQDELEGGAQELSAKVWQEPQRMGGVAALGHVRGQPALEVAIAEAGDFGEERQAQARLQVSSEAQQARGEGDLEEEQRCDEAEQHPDGTQALPDEPQLASEVKEGAEEQGFDDKAHGSEEQRRN